METHLILVEDEVEVSLVTKNVVIGVVVVVRQRKTIVDVGASIIIRRDVEKTKTQTPVVANVSTVVHAVIALFILKAIMIGRIALGISKGRIIDPTFSYHPWVDVRKGRMRTCMCRKPKKIGRG